jgi:chromosome segregation ATPase
MNEQEAQIKRIHEKLQQLLKRQDDLQKENAKLKKDLGKSSGALQDQLQLIDTLRQQVDVLKISAGNWEEEDRKIFEKRLNQYIREIDKCIAMLSE